MGTTPTAARSSGASEAVAKALRGRRFDVRELVFEGVLLLTLLISLGVLITLLVDVIRTSLPAFSSHGSAFFSQSLSGSAENAGIRQGLIGSMLLMLIVVVLAFPLGVGAAVYLEEYARANWFTRLLVANVRNLAGVPSIVYGLLGLAIFVLFAGSFTGGLSVISGGLTLAILVLPIVIITSSEAVRAVPASLREAAYGVGATKWEVIRSHVLPYAAPGILTGTILSLARALGETAPLILVGAVTGFFFVSGGNPIDQLRGPYTALPTIIFNWARLPGDDFKALTAAAIVVLMALILLVNGLAIYLRNRYERKW
jgi:phosphate transport system permease protein